MILPERKKIKPCSGFALVAIVLVLGIVLLVGSALYMLVNYENRISRSHEPSLETFYLAESGIYDVIYHLQNDEVWDQEFEDGTLDRSLSEADGLVQNGSYEVSVVSIDVGEAEIISVGKIEIYGAISQRIIKARALRATNTSPLENVSIYAGSILSSKAKSVVSNGDVFVNGDVELSGSAEVTVNGDLSVIGEIDIQGGSDLSVSGDCEVDNCPPECSNCAAAPEPIEMTEVDFDSADENSYKSQADSIYSKAEFDALLSASSFASPLVLNGIIYVEGVVEIACEHRLELYGLLVADGDIIICTSTKKDNAAIEVFHTVGEPSGLMTKGSIIFKSYPKTDNIHIEGILYAGDEIELKDLPNGSGITIIGSLYAETVDFRGSQGDIEITYDEDTFIESFLGPAAETPTIFVDHWEEQY